MKINEARWVKEKTVGSLKQVINERKNEGGKRSGPHIPHMQPGVVRICLGTSRIYAAAWGFAFSYQSRWDNPECWEVRLTQKTSSSHIKGGFLAWILLGQVSFKVRELDAKIIHFVQLPMHPSLFSQRVNYESSRIHLHEWLNTQKNLASNPSETECTFKLPFTHKSAMVTQKLVAPQRAVLKNAKITDVHVTVKVRCTDPSKSSGSQKKQSHVGF